MSEIWVFYTIIFISAIKPGPGILFFMGLTSSEAVKPALITAVGTDFGHFFIIFLLLMGLDIVKAFPLAISAIQILACLYIAYMGLQQLRKDKDTAAKRNLNIKDNFGLFLKGFNWTFVNPVNLAVYGSIVPYVIVSSETLNWIGAFWVSFVSALIYAICRLPYLLFTQKVMSFLGNDKARTIIPKVTGFLFLAFAATFLMIAVLQNF